MLSVTLGAALAGLEGYMVTVECSGQRNLPALSIVGLGDMAIREAKERLQAATVNSGILFPELELILNLAPANRRKEGSSLDLAMLVSVLQCGHVLPADLAFPDTCFIGELSLSGAVRPLRGVLNMALAAKASGIRTLFVPK